MKKLLFITAIFLAFYSCDKIRYPNQRPPAVYNCVDSLTRVTKNNFTISNTRKVLLEDFTGHLCPNCPGAADIAEHLLETHGNRLVVIANHVTTTYARPRGDSLYKEDFRNPISNEWDSPTNFAISNSGLPNGMVNRMKPFAQGQSAWSSLVSTALNKPQVARLDVSTAYDTKSHYLTVKVKTTFLTSLSNNVNLVIALTQDSIVSDQQDNSPPPDAEIDPEDPIRRLNYRFDHIVFGSMNGAWGNQVKAAPIAANDTATINNECFLLEKCFFKSETKPSVCLNDRHVNVVAFIYDTDSKEILQVEKVKIR
jgi:hypothetical protein